MSKNEIIAFQGVHGANADVACRHAYPYHDTLPVATFEDAMRSVEEGKAGLCMIPMENSQAGRVAEIHNLLPKTKLYIVGEHFERIEHFLAAPKGTKLKDIKIVYSHPQALMQCKDSLVKLGVKKEAYANTAMAAEDVAKWNDKSKAAICSRLAADLYGLEIIKENIEDSKANTTMFISMAAEPLDVDRHKHTILTSLLFTARNIPAALYKALGGFATNNVNIIKLESYIPGGVSQTAHFFITFEGHPEERRVQLSLEELGFFCKKVKMLGVYTAAQDRS
jgi:prephenate dehydratase